MHKLLTLGLASLFLVVTGCKDTNTTGQLAGPSFHDGGDGGNEGDHSSSSGRKFDGLVGVPRPFTGSAHAIRGVSGAGLPWVLEEGEAELDEDGTLEIEVEGLVIDPDDPTAIGLGVAGTNPSSTFGGLLSCLTLDADGNAVTVNLATTGRFPATGAGDSEIEEKLTGIPDPCIAPIVFVTSQMGQWFAASGFFRGFEDDDDDDDADSDVETEADLDGSQEVPSVVTNMTGEVEVEIEDGQLEFELEVSNNTHDIFAAHIHCAPPGVNGPVGVTLFTGSFTAASGTLAEGTVMAPDAGNGCGWADISAVTAAIQSGNTYVNVHTTSASGGVPSGEIRGNLPGSDDDDD